MTSRNFGHFWPPSLHRHTFYYWGLSTVVTKSLTPSFWRPWRHLWTTSLRHIFKRSTTNSVENCHLGQSKYDNCTKVALCENLARQITCNLCKLGFVSTSLSLILWLKIVKSFKFVKMVQIYKVIVITNYEFSFVNLYWFVLICFNCFFKVTSHLSFWFVISIRHIKLTKTVCMLTP